jgi:hypothetical protein
MTETQLLKYCLFYNGEVLCPERFARTSEGELWTAEKYVCENLQGKIDESDPQLSLARWVAAYVGKWDPFGWREVMNIYMKLIPDSKSRVDFGTEMDRYM